jgi:dihydrofolate synthase/folylpolyglutamate synthase
MNYADAIHFLYDLRLFGLKLGLENTFKLAALAGDPQLHLRFIHVAGTNGKGSTCAMLESIYRAAGRRVGLFTSPHLVSFRERVQVNRTWIPQAEVTRLVADLQPLLKQFPAEHHPTFFEVVTVMALRYFAEQACELVIWETGMGGRLDATNIVTPLASVITNVELDHQQWLGATHAEIAAEKAGIIKPGVPVLTATAQPEALAVIEATARALNAPLTLVSPACDSAALPGPLDSPALLGEHQRLNARLAAATVQVLQPKLPVRGDAIQVGLTSVQWPGRLQILRRPTGQTLVLDGAHNVAGALALRTSLEKLFPGVPLTLVIGVLQDKDVPGICAALAPLAARVLVVPVNSERSAPPTVLQEAFGRAAPKLTVTTLPSLAAALAASANDPFVLVTGSLYLVGEALERLGLAEADPADGRRLNDPHLGR